MASKLFNYTDSDIEILQDLNNIKLVKPNEFIYINPENGFSIYSFDEKRKVHKHDTIKKGKIPNGNSIAVGQLVYEQIIFINDKGHECNDIIGLGFIVPNYIDVYYNKITFLIYIFTLLLLGALLFILNRKIIFYK